MSKDSEQTPEEGQAIIVAALFAALPSEHQAQIVRRQPKRMGEIAGILAQVLPPEELAGLSPGKTPEPAESPSTGSKRFSKLRTFVAKIPLVRRFL